jgi:hypothetical protein
MCMRLNAATTVPRCSHWLKVWLQMDLRDIVLTILGAVLDLIFQSTSKILLFSDRCGNTFFHSNFPAASTGLGGGSMVANFFLSSLESKVNLLTKIYL